MKYQNANNILPVELVDAIQQYVQGEYIYIPIKNKLENSVPTEYETELQRRDEHIYTRHLEGVNNKKLSHMYNLSESSIRRIILKQRKRHSTMENRIKNIISHWSIEPQEIIQIYDTAWQIGNDYILKVYENLELLERNIKIITILDDMNIPVGKNIPTIENHSFAKDEQYYYILSERLPGSNIVSIRNKPDLAFEMGRIIANLHLAFQKCETQDTFWNNSLLTEMKGWIRKSLSDDGWQHIEERSFNSTLSNLETLYNCLPVQLIHRDVHFGNFLFQDGKFSGYIDFDLSQRNIRIFDLCYFMLGLLSEEEKLDITEVQWFEILENVFAGYHQIARLTEEEKQAVPYVMQSIELLFTAWFLKQNDTKCAENAVQIYKFVDKNKNRIIQLIEV